MERNEILKHVKALYEYNQTSDKLKNELIIAFPELRESEDENIIKKLIHLVKKSHEQGGYALHKWEADKMLDWLEKQIENKGIDEISYKIGIKRVLDNPKSYGLEKQDKTILDSLKDYVKPKFHEGDWTVSNLDGNARQISEVHFDEYNSYYVVNGKSVNLEEYDRLHHLWSIQDAKDGDVLSNGKMVVIFKHFEEPSYRQHIVAYIGLDNNGNIQITDDTWTLGIDKAKPATKEQCEILFAKMIESGYEWDAEKKELKKIEPLTDFEKAFQGMCCEKNKQFVKECCKTLIELAKKQLYSEWSEEDEKMKIHTLQIIKKYWNSLPDTDYGENEISESCYNWLKYLNGRIGWTPSEEQIDALEEAMYPGRNFDTFGK